MISNFLDNHGDFHLKQISVILMSLLLLSGNHVLNRGELRIVFYAVILFFLNIPVTGLFNGDIYVSLRYNLFLFVIVCYVYSVKKINLKETVNNYMNILYFLGFFIILGNVFSLVYPIPKIISFLRSFAMNYDEYEGIRTSGFLGPKIYFHFTLFLPSAFAYHVFSRRYFQALILLSAIVLSFSRGAIFTAFLILLIWLLVSRKITLLSKLFILAFLLGLVYLVIEDLTPRLFEHIFNSVGELGEGTRRHQIVDIYRAVLQQPVSLILGFGSGTPLFSTFLNEYVWNIEIAHLELVRKYGVFFGSILVLYPLNVVIKFWKKDWVLFCSLLSLYIATLSNPIFTSPMFIFLFMIANRLSYGKS